jgi:hypothetical protein
MSTQLHKEEVKVKALFAKFPPLANTVWRMYDFNGFSQPKDTGFTWKFLAGDNVQDSQLVWTGHWKRVTDVSIDIIAIDDKSKLERVMELTFITDSYFVATGIDTKGKATIINIGSKV